MYIADAVRNALEGNGCITTPDWAGMAKIRPTNGPGNCVLMDWDGSRPSRYGWQPTANELIRDDWYVTA